MGTVHLAHDMVLDKRVALKRLIAPGFEHALARRQLLHEGRALAALDHPGIARVQDVLDGSPPALILEYVDGLSLKEWLQASHDSSAALRLLFDVLDAVAYAHACAVVHCDLKPGNVLVSASGRAKIVDFGIALMLERAATTTLHPDETRQPAYTPRYAAPEVKRGHTPTPASDVYSLGVLIDELLDASAEATTPGLHRLRRVAARARAEAIENRYRTAAELRDALRVTAGPGEATRSRWRAFVPAAMIVGAGCVSSGMALVGDAGRRAFPVSHPVLAVVTRVDAASAPSLSAAAADLVRNALRPLVRARLVSSDVPALREDTPQLIKSLADKGLSHVLVPTVASAGSGVRLSVAILRADTGQVVHTATRYGRSDALAELSKDVAIELREWFGEAQPRRTGSPVKEPGAAALAQYSQARQYSERPDVPGNLARARVLLERVVQAAPQFAAAHAELGRVLLLTHRDAPAPELLVHAQAAVMEAVALQPEAPEARVSLAIILNATGKRAQAIGELHRALGRVPDDDRALAMLGQWEASQGNVDAGVRLLETAVGIRASWVNRRALGTVLFNVGRYAEAAAQFAILVDLQSDNPWGYQMLGSARQQLGQLDAAATAYQQSLAIRPTAAVLSNLATLEYGRGNLTVSEGLYEQALQIAGADPVVLRNLGDVRLRLGKIRQARQSYEDSLLQSAKMLAIDRAHLIALSTSAYASARLGDCVNARHFTERLIKISLDDVGNTADAVNAQVLCGHVDLLRPLVRALERSGTAPLAVLEVDIAEKSRGNREVRELLGVKSEGGEGA
jgi:serine/threonine protein kinase/tetratricopeptide (TPR) repeat protein